MNNVMQEYRVRKSIGPSTCGEVLVAGGARVRIRCALFTESLYVIRWSWAEL